MSTKKSSAMEFMEELSGGPLTIGGLLKSIRLGEGLSLVAFSKSLQISKSHLCDIEKGRKSVSIERAAEFAKALGYSQKQFIGLAIEDMLKKAGLSYSVRLTAA